MFRLRSQHHTPAPSGRDQAPDQDRIAWVQQAMHRLKATIQEIYIGQDEVVYHVILGLLARGNVLLEGPPGLGKTLLVSVLARALELDYARIQFTPDLMPADITGTTALMRGQDGQSELRFHPGPIFANIVLADEINRATPKTQSALLEAMQEKSVTVNGQKRQLPPPFFVLATQNPIEMEGTYPLPEAQLDRFIFKLQVPFPDRKILREIGLRTTGAPQPEISPVIGKDALLTIQDLVSQIVVSTEIADLAARLVLATHPDGPETPEAVRRYVQWGASPRAMQALLNTGRAAAILDGRAWVRADDLRAVAPHVLRHRMILNFEAQLDKISADGLVDELLKHIRT